MNHSPSKGSVELREGDKAPDFAVRDQDDRIHRLQDYQGKRVLLYFYGKDDTPG
jgi:peroxiredoxin Q/BCP